MCAGSDGNAECSARPTMTARSGDHSSEAAMRWGIASLGDDPWLGGDSEPDSDLVWGVDEDNEGVSEKEWEDGDECSDDSEDMLG
jgi:hypothetical protein